MWLRPGLMLFLHQKRSDMGILSLFGIKPKSEKVLEALEAGAVIVDVRAHLEYKNDGHINKSYSIPLNQIEARVPMLKKKNKIVIVCGKTSGKSAKACKILEKHGIPCVNAGKWGDLNYLIH